MRAFGRKKPAPPAASVELLLEAAAAFEGLKAEQRADEERTRRQEEIQNRVLEEKLFTAQQTLDREYLRNARNLKAAYARIAELEHKLELSPSPVPEIEKPERQDIGDTPLDKNSPPALSEQPARRTEKEVAALERELKNLRRKRRKELQVSDVFRVLYTRKEGVLMTFFVVGVLGLVWLFRQTVSYTASADVRIFMDTPTSGEALQFPDVTSQPFFRFTQAQVLTSKELVARLVDDLNLTHRLSTGETPLEPEEAIRIVQEGFQSHASMDADVTTLRLTLPDRKLAYTALNRYIELYREFRTEKLGQHLRNTMKSLHAERARAASKVEKAEQHLGALRKNLGITLIRNRGLLEDDRLSALASTLMEAKQDLLEEQAVLEQVDALLEQEELEAAVLLFRNREDRTVQWLWREIITLEADLQSMLVNLGERHPRVISQKQILATTKQHYEKRIRALRHNQEVRVRTREALLRKLEDEMKESEALHQAAFGGRLLPFYNAWAELDFQRDLLKSVDVRLARVEEEQGAFRPVLQVVNPAGEEWVTAKPDVLQVMALLAIGGLLLGFLVALTQEYLDVSVKTVEQAETVLGRDVVGMIPNAPGHRDADREGGELRHAIEDLSAGLRSLNQRHRFKSWLVTSARAKEGKSFVAEHLAKIWADEGEQVILVDTNVLQPGLTRRLGCADRPGLTDVLNGRVSLRDALVMLNDHLEFLPVGRRLPEDPPRLAETSLPALIAEAEKRSDAVIVDAPPVVGFSDTLNLAAHADVTLLVVEYMKHPLLTVAMAADSVARAGSVVGGVILNKVHFTRDLDLIYLHTKRERKRLTRMLESQTPAKSP